MLGRKGSHLNAYLLAKIIKTELTRSTDDALQSKLGKNVRKPPSKARIALKKRRKEGMADLRDHNTDLKTYMTHMGSMSEKYDKRSKEVISKNI